MSYCKHNAHCEVDEWVTSWQEGAITVCPINNTHTITEGSDSVVMVARCYNQVPVQRETSSTTWVNVGSFMVQGADYWAVDHAPLKYFIISAKTDLGTFDMQIVDDSSTVLWSSTNNSNQSYVDFIFDFETITIPAAHSVFTLQVKTGAGYTATLRHASLYISALPA